MVVELDLAADASGSPDPAERAGALDLERVLRRLSPDERAPLVLRYEADLDSAEIGALAGRPSSTVRWQLARSSTL